MSSRVNPDASDQLSLRKRPLTAAEKQRNYRERLKQSPKKYELFKQREAERQRERSKTRVKTEEQIASQRMKWRERVRKHRLKKKQEALMSETQFQDTYEMSEGSTNSSVMPQVFDGSEELAMGMSFNRSGYGDVEYSQGNANSCPNMNIGEYVMDAHNNRSRDESDNVVVKLECNTPEREDESTHAFNIEAGNQSFAQQVNDDGNLAIVDQIPFQQQTGLLALSQTERFFGEPSKKRKPLTPAERQRNYRARVKAQKRGEPNAKIVSEPNKSKYQQRVKRGLSPTSTDAQDSHGERSTEEEIAATECIQSNADAHLDMGLYVVKLEQDGSYAQDSPGEKSAEETVAATECIQSNAYSQLDMGLLKVKLEQYDSDGQDFLDERRSVEGTVAATDCIQSVGDSQVDRGLYGMKLEQDDLDAQDFPDERSTEEAIAEQDNLDVHGTSNRDDFEDDILDFTPDVSNSYTSSYVVVGDSFYEKNLEDGSNENKLGVGQNQVDVRRRPNNIEDMQDQMLPRSCRPRQKKLTLTPAEWQRRYRARLKANQMIQQQQQQDGPSISSLVEDLSGRLPQEKSPLTSPARMHNVRARREAQPEMIQQQQQQLEGPTVSSLTEYSSGQLQQEKRRPLTSTERMRNYRARQKANREMMEKQKKMSEEAAVRRSKAAERKREYRRKKKDSGVFSSTSHAEMFPIVDNNVVNGSIPPDDNCTNVSLEVIDYSHAETFGEIKSEIEGDAIGHGTIFQDGNPSHVEQSQSPLPKDQSVLSLAGGASGQLAQKKWPMTPAERQRNYRARRKATQEMMQKRSEDAASLRRRKAAERKREYRRRKKEAGDYPPTKASTDNDVIANNGPEGMNDILTPEPGSITISSNDDSLVIRDYIHGVAFKDGIPVNFGEMQTGSQEIPSNRTLIAIASGQLPPKKWPLTPAERQRNYRARQKAKREMTQEQLEDAASLRRRKATERKREYRRRKKEGGDYPATCSAHSALKSTYITPHTSDNQTNVFLEVTDYGNGSVYMDENPTTVEEMQTRFLQGPSVLSQSGNASGRLPQKKWPMTPAERQRNYKARQKAKQEMMQKQSEDAASLRRRKAAERKREYRQRKKESATSDTKALANDDVIHVKHECTDPDEIDNYTNAMMEGREYSHAERYRELTSGIENGVAAVFGDGSLNDVEEMQTRLMAGSAVLSPVACSTGQSSKKMSPLTNAEKQRQYRARLKTEPEKWQQYKSRDAERRKKLFEMNKMSESAAALRRKKARERQRAYRHRKRQNQELSVKNRQKEDLNMKNRYPSSTSSWVDISSTRTGCMIRATKVNQNRYRSSDYMQTQTDSHLDVNSAEWKALDVHRPTILEKIECNTPVGDGKSIHEENCFPEQHSVQVPSEKEGRDLGQVPRRPSGPSRKGAQRRQKRRRPMTPAERQRKYRARLKANAEQGEQQRSSDTERPGNVKEQTEISQDATSEMTKMAEETKDQPEKRDVEESDAHDKHDDTGKTDLGPETVDSLSTRTTRSSTAARRQPSRSVKNQPTIGVVVKTEQREDGRFSNTERSKQEVEDEIAYRRKKGRERMRKYRLKKKQMLQNDYLEFAENDMPEIASVWSAGERDQLRAQMDQENFCGNSPKQNTHYFPGYFGNPAPVGSLSTMSETDTKMTITVTQDDAGSSLGFDSSSHSTGSDNTLHHLGTPARIASQMSRLNHSEEEEGRSTFQDNEIPFRTRRLTSAERQRRYRERLQQNPEKWAAYKQKASNRYLARKEVATIQQVVKHRKQTLIRTRRWRAKVKEGKNLKDISLNDAVQDGIFEEETPTSHQSFPAESIKRSSIAEKFAGFIGVKATGPSWKKRNSRTPEQIRQANRERQRRYRARKRGELEESMPGSSSFAVDTNHPEFTDFRGVNGMEMSQDPECSTLFRICPDLSSSKHTSPRNRGRPQMSTKYIEQPAQKWQKKRGRPPKHSHLMIEQPTDAVTTDTIVSPLGDDCPGGVLVSSAGNLPMVIRTAEVKGESDVRWEEIPQVIPCDPPEEDFDWGNVDLEHFQQDLDEVTPVVKVEVTDPVLGEVEGGSVSGSARRKAFCPTRHDTADLTLNAAWAVETPLGDPSKT